MTTHLHNGHTPSESDGFPCDHFETGQFYDQHYPNAHAGFTTPDIVPPEFRHAVTGGDIRESLGTLWYHDHRVDFTSQNAYKGLAGFYLLYNGDGTGDSGDETTGFRLPSGRFDVPLMFNDKVFDNGTGEMFFDLFNLDGILGDKFLVNGCLQPFFEVQARRYRFRLLSGGPSRFYQFHLFDPAAPTMIRPFWQISSDGNLLPRPIFSTGHQAERRRTRRHHHRLHRHGRQDALPREPSATDRWPGTDGLTASARRRRQGAAIQGRRGRGGEDTDHSTNPVTLPPSSVAPFVTIPWRRRRSESPSP